MLYQHASSFDWKTHPVDLTTGTLQTPQVFFSRKSYVMFVLFLFVTMFLILFFPRGKDECCLVVDLRKPEPQRWTFPFHLLHEWADLEAEDILKDLDENTYKEFLDARASDVSHAHLISTGSPDELLDARKHCAQQYTAAVCQAIQAYRAKSQLRGAATAMVANRKFYRKVFPLRAISPVVFVLLFFSQYKKISDAKSKVAASDTGKTMDIFKAAAGAATLSTSMGMAVVMPSTTKAEKARARDCAEIFVTGRIPYMIQLPTV